MIVSILRGFAKVVKAAGKTYMAVQGSEDQDQECYCCGRQAIAGNRYCQGCLADMDRDESRNPISSDETDRV